MLTAYDEDGQEHLPEMIEKLREVWNERRDLSNEPYRVVTPEITDAQVEAVRRDGKGEPETA